MLLQLTNLFFPVGLVLLIVLGLSFINFLLKIEVHFGIIPRKLGLTTVARWFLSWGVHADKNHLISNLMSLLPLIVIFFVLLDQSLSIFFYVVIAQSVATWIFGSSKHYYVGASGVIYALFGYIVTYVLMDHTTYAQWIAAITVFLTMGLNMFYGLIKVDKDVSSLAHLLGLLSGVAVQYLNHVSI